MEVIQVLNECVGLDGEESCAFGVGMLQEQRAYLQSKISTLRRETRELCSQISQKQRKQSDFRNDINNHLSSVANQKQHLSMRAEGLEMEQRQLQALDAQHKQEERFLRPRLDEAVADHAATEARIQVLMDRLVVLLSSANSASSTMTSQILEEFQGSILNLDEKIQTGKARLESARRENHDFAIRLSDEQAETKTLHDKLCSLQSRLYQGRYFAAKRAEAGDLLAESPSRAAQTVDDKSCSPGRCRRCEHTETPAVSSTNGESNWSCGATQKTPAPTTENGLSDRRAVEAMEETLRETLDRISFQEPVVRVRPGLYTFGEDQGYLRRTSDGTVLARPGANASTSLDGSEEWLPLEDFLSDLSLKRSREFEQRHGRHIAENTSAQNSPATPTFPGPGVTAESAVATTESEDDRDTPRLGSAGDDAAGYGGKKDEAMRRLIERVGELEAMKCDAANLKVSATAGDEAAGKESPRAEVVQTSMRRLAGANGDEAAGHTQEAEIRSSGSKSALACVGGVSPLKKISSIPRLSEQPCEGANGEKTSNHLMSGGSSGSCASADNSVLAMSSNNGGRGAAQVSAPSSVASAPATSSRAPSLPASPQLGNRSLGSIRSVAGMVSPTRIASPRLYGASSPTRIALGSKTGSSSPSKWTPQATQSRAQPPPATARHVVPPQRAVVGVPVSAPPLALASPSQSSRPSGVSPRRVLPRSKSPQQLHISGGAQISPRSMSAGSGYGVVATTPRGIVSPGGAAESTTTTASRRYLAQASSTLGGSLELPVGGMLNRGQSNSPSRRLKSPVPSLRSGTPGQLAVRTPPGGMPVLALAQPLRRK